MGTKKLKVLIAGAGGISKVHGAAYQNIDSTEITAVVDIIPSRAQDFAKKHNCAWYTDLDEAIRGDFDILDACLPTTVHKYAAIEGLKAGKHVLCEKPIALTVQDAQEMVEASEKYGGKLMIAHCLQFMPEYEKLRSMV